jgi:hypothetical protein
MKEGAINFAPSFYLIHQANPINGSNALALIYLIK